MRGRDLKSIRKYMKKDILGVKIDDLSMSEALDLVQKWVWQLGPDSRQSRNRGSSTNEIRREKHYIVTPNPEIIVAAQKDQIFKEILNKADLAIPDGAGLKLSGRIKNTFAGVDFMEALVKRAAEKGFTVSFLGGREGVAEKCSERLKKRYPNLKVVYAGSGGEVDMEGIEVGSKQSLRPDGLEKWDLESLKSRNLDQGIKNSIPPTDILFVAFGHLKQEKWIAANLDEVPAHVMMAVGGAFDYLSGSVLRAPEWIRGIGLEWLFRLAMQPWRIKRQLALIKYLALLAL